MQHVGQAWILSALVVIAAFWMARTLRLHRLLFRPSSSQARTHRAGVLIDLLCEIWLERASAVAAHAQGSTAGRAIDTDDLVAMTRQLVRSDADPGVAFAALEFEADRINLQARVLRRLMLVAACVFPVVAANSSLTHALSLQRTTHELVGLVVCAAGLGYLTVALAGARMLQRAWDAAERSVLADAMLLARGTELIARGVNPDGLRTHLHAYAAQPESPSDEGGLLRRVA